MRKYLVNYADKIYYNSQKNNSNSGINVCKFDAVFSYNKIDLDTEFVNKNNHILSLDRGAGYWMWKPYVILKALSEIEENDILFYSDSGITFIKPLDSLIEIMDKGQEKILVFELEDFHPNKRWTKRDCFYYMNLDTNPFLDQPQILASYMLMRKNSFVIDFMKEWLEYAQDYRIITDSPNECGLPNYPEFYDHRHDQSIFSLLSRKYNLINIPDISQYGSGRWITEQIIEHHRSRG